LTPLKEVLVALGGNATLLLVLGFLARSLLQTWLAKDVERFKAGLQREASSELERLKCELRSQADVSIEQLKSRLQQAIIEHQVRFSRLHERRAEAIEQLYSRACDLELEAARYASTLGRGGSEQDGTEMYQQVLKKLFDFDGYRDRYRIYLPDEINALICEFVTAVREPIVAIGVYGDFGTAAHETLRQHSETILKALQATSQHVPSIRSKLIKEFRIILSGE
jgi:hypothetical protein